MSSFFVDDSTQRKMRDRFLVPYYDRIAKGRFVLVDGAEGSWARKAQTLWGSGDTLMRDADTGDAIMIEEKIMELPYKPGHFFENIAVETTKPRGFKGWIHYAQADLLVYCFTCHQDVLDVYFIDLQSFKLWFFKEDKAKPFQRKTVEDGHDAEGRLREFTIALVPLVDVAERTSLISKRVLLGPGGVPRNLDPAEPRRELGQMEMVV